MLLSTLGLVRWSFEQGFLDYVNALEEARLQLLAASLSREYLVAGSSWSTLTGGVSLLLAIVVLLLLTRVLLVPIRRAISGISRLSSGDYSTRLNERRRDELGQLMGDLDRLAHKLEESRPRANVGWPISPTSCVHR